MPAPSRSVLITGGTSGLGYQCAIEVARQRPGHQIVLASRTDPNSAATSINKLLGQSNVVFLPLDLSSLSKVRTFVDEWSASKYAPIQYLLLNAGLQIPDGVRYSSDGMESTFAINHVGHALLLSLLRPYFADKARVVITASGTHDPAQNTGLPDAKYNTAEELAHPTPETAKNDGLQRYTTSKLVNIMWAYALDRRFSRLPGKSWSVVAFDPGLMPGTAVARESGPVFRFLWSYLLPHIIPLLRFLIGSNVHTPKESGASLAWLALSPNVEGSSGEYYEGRKKIKSSVDSYDEQKQEDLWQWTVKTIAKNEDEIDAFSMKS